MFFVDNGNIIQGVSQMRTESNIYFFKWDTLYIITFLGSRKIWSIMMYRLSTFNCLFRSYKQLEFDFLAYLAAIYAKSV